MIELQHAATMAHHLRFDSDRYNFGSSTDLNPKLNSWTVSLWTKVVHTNNHNILLKYSSGNGFYLKLYTGGTDTNYFAVRD